MFKNKFLLFFTFAILFLIISLGVAYYFYLQSVKEPEVEVKNTDKPLSQWEKKKREQIKLLDSLKPQEKMSPEEIENTMDLLEKLKPQENNEINSEDLLNNLNNKMSSEEQMRLLESLK